MVSLYAVWVPAFVVAHLAGIILLLYSLEQVSAQSAFSPLAALKQILQAIKPLIVLWKQFKIGRKTLSGKFTWRNLSTC